MRAPIVLFSQSSCWSISSGKVKLNRVFSMVHIPVTQVAVCLSSNSRKQPWNSEVFYNVAEDKAWWCVSACAKTTNIPPQLWFRYGFYLLFIQWLIGFIREVWLSWGPVSRTFQHISSRCFWIKGTAKSFAVFLSSLQSLVSLSYRDNRFLLKFIPRFDPVSGDLL